MDVQVDQSGECHEGAQVVGGGRLRWAVSRDPAEADATVRTDDDQAVGLVERATTVEWSQEPGADRKRRPIRNGRSVNRGPARRHEPGC